VSACFREAVVGRAFRGAVARFTSVTASGQGVSLRNRREPIHGGSPAPVRGAEVAPRDSLPQRRPTRFYVSPFVEYGTQNSRRDGPLLNSFVVKSRRMFCLQTSIGLRRNVLIRIYCAHGVGPGVFRSKLRALDGRAVGYMDVLAPVAQKDSRTDANLATTALRETTMRRGNP